MNKETCLELQALVDGELDRRRRDAVSRRCAEDPDARQLAAALAAVREVLRQHEPEHRVPETREFYWNQIERRLAAAQARSAPPVPGRWDWLRWLIPVAGAAVVALLVSFPNAPTAPSLAGTSPERPDPGTQLASSVTYRSDSDGVTVHWIQ